MGLKGYINKQLDADERVIYRTGLSWKPIVMRFALFVILGIVACVCANTFLNNTTIAAIALAAFVVIGALVQIPRVIRNLGVDIVITNKRMHTKDGLILIKNDREASLARVDDTDIDFHTLFQRIFNYGSIDVHTIGGECLVKYDCVARPRELKRALHQAKSSYSNTPTDDLRQAELTSERSQY